MGFRSLLRRAAVVSTGVGLALTGLTVPAQAASDTTWNRLAQCESGGRWHINTGNGYYGGLQFSLGSWRAVGGTRYASRPDLASRTQQVAAAERLLDIQGWGAWPACSRKLGLGPAQAAGTPASLRPKKATVIKEQPNRVVHAGTTLRSSFKLRKAGGAALVRRQLTVCRSKHGVKRTVCRTHRTNRQGVVVHSQRVTHGMKVWAKFRGDKDHKPTTSRRQSIRVRAAANLQEAVPATTAQRAGLERTVTPATLRVRVVPRRPAGSDRRLRVELQQQLQDDWRPVRRVRVSARGIAQMTAAEGRYRAVVLPATGVRRGVSPVVDVRA